LRGIRGGTEFGQENERKGVYTAIQSFEKDCECCEKEIIKHLPYRTLTAQAFTANPVFVTDGAICEATSSHLLFLAEIIRVKTLIRTSESYCIRTLLLISVLVTLCISEGVGLQLLPIPNASGVAVSLAEASQMKVRTEVPSPPSREKNIASRVEIIAPKLEGLSHQQSFQIDTAVLSAAPHLDVSLPHILSSTQGPASEYSGIFVSQGASRAPPFQAYQ
jgi:hypothetical protein